ncbi:MAG: hypothetical protein ABIU06_15670 [Anaerolineales bacterium]
MHKRKKGTLKSGKSGRKVISKKSLSPSGFRRRVKKAPGYRKRNRLNPPDQNPEKKTTDS